MPLRGLILSLMTAPRIYFVCVAFSAAGLLAWLSQQSGLHHTEFPIDWLGIGWCVFIGVVAEAVALDFKIGPPGKQVRSSLAFLPFLSALTLYPLAVASAIILAVGAISQFILRRGVSLTRLFNVAQGVIAGVVAGSLFAVIVGQTNYDLRNPYFVVGAVVLAGSFFLTNMFLNAIALTLLKSDSFQDVVKKVIGPGAANLWYDLLASPVALVPVLLYRDSPVTGMVLIMLPLLLIQYSYLSKQLVIDTNRDIVRALIKAIETRDPYTSGHSLRVATMARTIARDLKLSERKVHHIEMAALLHDIGKIDPAYAVVLSKPYDLTEEERCLIETHSARGAALLREMKSVPEDVVASVHHHHERFDGQGYPDQIAGTVIPLAARIIMICDSIDAMLSDRPYRKALSVQIVEEELRRCAGTQFDPDIVETVLAKHTLNRATSLITADTTAGPVSMAVWP